MSKGPVASDIIAAMSRITEFDAGFICGLVTGEGSFTGDRKQPVLAIKLHEDDPEPLLFIQEKLGGKIYGPYCHDGRRYYFWRLMGKSLWASLPLFADRLPASRKRHQFTGWIEKHGVGRDIGDYERTRLRRELILLKAAVEPR